MNKIKLKINWSKKEECFITSYPGKSDGGWIIEYKNKITLKE